METKEIGYISKTHGLKGYITLRLLDFTDISEDINSVFLDINKSLVPYFIEECNPVNMGYLLKLETISTVDDAKKLVGKKVHALVNFIIEDEDSLQEFVGYSIIDKKHGNIGVIIYIDEKTQNIIAHIQHPSGKEIILPFNEELIKDIDNDKKIILFEAPDGLIEMYIA